MQMGFTPFVGLDNRTAPRLSGGAFVFSGAKIGRIARPAWGVLRIYGITSKTVSGLFIIASRNGRARMMQPSLAV